jgi:DNA-binding response OmpR family regulator
MPETAAAPAPRPTVLVVEDEALVAMLVEDALAEAGYGSVLSPDGHAASAGREGDGTADAMAAAVVDLRLADGLDGRDVIRRLRARRPALPVVVVTGFLPQAPEADLRGLGGPTLRLCKPFDCENLAGGVEALLDAPAVPATPRRRRTDRLKTSA